MRKNLLYILVIGSGVIFSIRLFSLQVSSSDYQSMSLQNSVLREYIYPERGYIYDRNGKLIVENQPTYDLMVVPRQLRKIDTIEFCNLLKITKTMLRKKIKEAKTYSTRKPSVFLAQLSKSDYAALQEKLWKYHGFYVQKRAARKYNSYSASNILGYISEVNRFDISKDPYYQSGELIGRQGIEKTYEKILRGVKGVRYSQRDKFNRVIGPYQKGELDTLPTQAQNLYLTIDIALQEYGEKTTTKQTWRDYCH
jgi:penicillin-binding protein 2